MDLDALVARFSQLGEHAQAAVRLMGNVTFAQRCRKYHVSVGDAVETWISQRCACAICGEGTEIDALVFDHNHATGEFRGLLCGNCNTGIGLLGDTPAWLESAARYLRTAGHYGPDVRREAHLAVAVADWRAELVAASDASYHCPDDVKVPASEHRKYHRLFGQSADCPLCRVRDGGGCSDSCLCKREW